LQVFHPNLRFILLSFPWCYLGMFIASFAKDLWEKIFPLDQSTTRTIDSLILICLVAICLNLFIFVMERIIALFYLHTYESHKFTTLSLLLFLDQLSSSSIIIVFTR
ncbi:hypothetical protein PFISCL1PPCAC_6345, partial [Pristionchus fissidentatus]